MWKEILKSQINLVREKNKIIKGNLKQTNKTILIESKQKVNKFYKILDWNLNIIYSKSKVTILSKNENLIKNIRLKLWNLEATSFNKNYKYNWENIKEIEKLKQKYLKIVKKKKYKNLKIKNKIIKKILKIFLKKKLKKIKIYLLWFWKKLINKWKKFYLLLKLKSNK